jgi:hypothetical protein
MKKILCLTIISFFYFSLSFAGVAGSYKKGKGPLKISTDTANLLEYYFSGGKKGAYAQSQKESWIGELIVISADGNYYSWFNTPTRYKDNVAAGHYTGQAISSCKKKSGQECYLFASRNTIVWDNGTPYKKRRLKRKDIKAGRTLQILQELGFYDGGYKSQSNNDDKKDEKKIAKKKEVKGERSVAISWDGYEELIIGTVGYEESDDGKTSMNLDLPNNDGSCEGTYLLQNGGKGTWLLACSNNMGAAGTLNWNDDGSVTGSGRDYKDKKVKFTVAKRS